jgi:ribose transport system permease protein
VNISVNTKHLRSILLQYGGLLTALAILIAFFSLQTDSFFQIGTARLIANQIPELTLVAIGMTLVLMIGQIDLSVGSVMALSGAVLGVLMAKYDWPLWAAIFGSLLTGAACGWTTGAISVWFRIPSFIVSLGMLEVARGATRRVLNSNTLTIGSDVAVISEPIGGLGLSPAFLLAILAVLAVQFVLSKTVMGRYCIAIGTNLAAARMSGIRTAPYSIGVFTLSGLLCGLAGLAPASLMEAADPGAGIGIELSAIAACVIGGTSLMGGRGNVISTLLGVLVIAVLQTGLSRMSVEDANKQIITGVVIIIAVLIDTARRRWERAST